MIIPEDPHKGLLNDENATAFVSEQLKLWTNLLRDLANYGSHLIPRAFSSSDKTLGDAVVIGILLRQLVAMIDAIEILLCRSAVHAASLQLRAMFEASIYIEWMLAGDREIKATYRPLLSRPPAPRHPTLYLHGIIWARCELNIAEDEETSIARTHCPRAREEWPPRLRRGPTTPEIGHPESSSNAARHGASPSAIERYSEDHHWRKIAISLIDRVLRSTALRGSL